MPSRKHFEQFQDSGSSYEDRAKPNPFYDALGRLMVNFSELEDALSLAIQSLLKTDPQTSVILTADLSFRAKVQMANVLYRQRHIKYLDVLRELVALCFEAEELRNRITHSSWAYSRDPTLFRRRKPSARTRSGFRMAEENITPDKMMDVADFIAYTAEMVDNFFGVDSLDFYENGSCQMRKEV